MVVSPQSSPAARANGGPGAITNPITIGMPSTPFVGAAAGVGRSSSGSPPAHAHSSIPVGAGARRAINGGGGGSGSGSGGWDTNAMKAMMRDDTSMAASRSEDGINLKNVSVVICHLILVWFGWVGCERYLIVVDHAFASASGVVILSLFSPRSHNYGYHDSILAHEHYSSREGLEFQCCSTRAQVAFGSG